MKFIADLHLHSRYSRATSGESTLDGYHRAGLIKGVDLLGTGDFTHPAWFSEIRDRLVPAEEGLFRLRDDLVSAAEDGLPESCRGRVRFMLSAEISSIYKKAGKTRKVHTLVYAPGIQEAGKIRARLGRIGNIESDGRPILGLDARDLLEIVLECADGAFVVPAHIWTPWFSVLGSKSGFDAVEECFGDLADRVFAVETGLSSDPPMNRSLSSLDRFALVSNSDAHSCGKVGREATLFDCDLGFAAVREALKSRTGLSGTIEFFPEEGKYHLDGHRKCGVRMTPEETAGSTGLCPACGKQVTVGVLNRVHELADRKDGSTRPDARGFRSVVPLDEIASECMGRGRAGLAVRAAIQDMVSALGPELRMLLDCPLEDIEHATSPLMAEAVRRMRAGETRREAGYDGEYGVIRLFDEGEIGKFKGQEALFDAADAPAAKRKPRRAKARAAACADARARESGGIQEASPRSEGPFAGLDDSQREAALSKGPLLVTAGPGTGKTKTLTARIAGLVSRGLAQPEEVLALTFTNRAAREMAGRLEAMLPSDAHAVTALTFHSFGLRILREHAAKAGRSPEFRVLSAQESESMFASAVRESCPGANARRISALREEASLLNRRFRSGAEPAGLDCPGDLDTAMAAYARAKLAADAFDFDDLVLEAARVLDSDRSARDGIRGRFRFVSVDELQDLSDAQYAFLKLIAPPGADVCAIGDPDQSIYGFRGASPGIFGRFEADYPATKTVRLGKSYRFTARIAGASGRMISKSGTGGGLIAAASCGEGRPVTAAVAADEDAEAESVARTIEGLIGGTSHFSMDSGRTDGFEGLSGLSFAGVAVLGRIEQTLAPVAAALDRAGIPFTMRGASPWAARQGVRAALAWMGKAIGKRGAAFNSATETADAAIRELNLESADADIISREAAAFGGDFRGFLDMLATGSDQECLPIQGDRVSILTIHASKGLEFPVVFVVGVEDGLIPLRIEGGIEGDPDEERRLLYVGMTRARECLFLSRAGKRRLFGRTLRNPESGFLAGIGSGFLERAAPSPKSRREGGRQLELF